MSGHTITAILTGLILSASVAAQAGGGCAAYNIPADQCHPSSDLYRAAAQLQIHRNKMTEKYNEVSKFGFLNSINVIDFLESKYVLNKGTAVVVANAGLRNEIILSPEKLQSNQDFMAVVRQVITSDQFWSSNFRDLVLTDLQLQNMAIGPAIGKNGAIISDEFTIQLNAKGYRGTSLRKVYSAKKVSDSQFEINLKSEKNYVPVKGDTLVEELMLSIVDPGT